MKVSIIIPTYNEQKDIRACLKSLVNQSYKDFEIIIVDDGSTDGTLSECKKSNIKCRIYKQEHKGAGAARNLGAEHAKGGILIFIDADMTFDRDFIKNLIKPILDAKAIGTFSKEEYLLNKDNIWARCWNINRGLPSDRMHSKDYPDTQNVFRAILTGEFEKAGGFDERAGYTDDWSLSEKLGVEAVNAPGAVFYHKNPKTLTEVFIQSKWMAKRKYKLGFLGNLFAIFRVSFPVSIVVGFVMSIYNLLLPFFVFKIVSDFGVFVGIFDYLLTGKVFK